MIRKIMSFLMLLLLAVTCVSCKSNVGNIHDESGSSHAAVSQELEILKTDLKLTQEQTLSQIKGDYLVKNNGYKDDDLITIVIKLKGDSLIDVYNEKYQDVYESVAEYTKSAAGQTQLAKINKQQLDLIKSLAKKNLINSIEQQYSTIVNAVAVETTYGELGRINKLENVETAIISDTYNLPKTTKGNNINRVENVVEVDPATGIFDSEIAFRGTEFEGKLTGNGTSVAILDSGFDCSHSVFKNQPEREDLTYSDIQGILGSMNSSKTTKGLKLSDVYYSKKIPYAYDYADKDSDVFPYDSQHGTHVAGIIGGKDDVIKGVAVDTQLVLMKVFPDLNAGADTEDILAALEDAVLLGVDAINMSLGSSCGFSREVDKENTNEIYDSIKAAGISLLTAASNSYSSSFSGEQGNTNFVTNPDSATVGSPSTYDASLSVASISGVKSQYIINEDDYIFFFNESNSITGDKNNFFKELGVLENQSKTFEYVTVPGVGLKVNFQALGRLDGKIALIKRGDNTFEEKALNAKLAGAAGCIIYNNVEGDIMMSMGKSDHIPTISISKEDGLVLASKPKGTLTITYNNQSGPFMSDFSSWGPTPNLGIKPEITAHGGDIYSSVPGGEYDHQSGTSMATPNLCGMVVLARQYLKEKYPTASDVQILELCNELLMSTANIVKNEYGNPYSPRKQGAGLASLFNLVNTKAYLTVDGSDRSKLELKDDPKRKGVYEMNFNVVNLTKENLTYDVQIDDLTESVSTSDEKHVAEKTHLLNGSFTVEVLSGGELKNGKVFVNAGETAKVCLTYKLSNEDKAYIEKLFPYGMFVEGFVKLVSSEENGVQLNMPFLAFYGDWTEAPMFDKTYYEVETEAHNNAIDDEDKIKADYFATTPYASYLKNLMIPLGTYIYDMDQSKYDPIPATEEHIAMSDVYGTMDGLQCVYAGLLRNAKQMNYTIIDKLTGEVVWSTTDWNASKSYSNGAMPLPYFHYLKLHARDLHLVNNRRYEFKMAGKLDYENDGSFTNTRNEFKFDFYFDNEAPILKGAEYEKKYDKNLKKDRYYVTLTIYDNHYVQSVTPLIFTSNQSTTFLTKNPIPVYSELGSDNKVKIEITDFLEDIYNDKVLPSALAFSIDDYALNSNIYLCQLPGTKGDFKFTKDGTPEGTDMLIYSMYEDEIIDLTNFLSTTDKTVDADKDYLNHLVWTSSNEKVAVVKEGIVKGVKAGKATVTCREMLDGKQAVLILNVKEREKPKMAKMSATTTFPETTIKNIRFSYFDTVFAYKRASEYSEIGKAGDRRFISSLNEISFYPGEKIRLAYDLDPWYVADKYEVTYETTNDQVVTVDQDGLVTAQKKGHAYIVLKVKGSNLMARVSINVKSEFVIENRTLIAYKGKGGDVVIPDDEGILYIGSFAFSLYDTDQNIEVDEDDYDANKIPGGNPSITSVVVPHGVEDIQKYAFYNCPNLEKVVLSDTVKYVREYSFSRNTNLKTINLDDIKVIGKHAFYECENLNNITMNKIYAIGVQAFQGCKSLTYVDLTTLRNTGKEAFKNCSNLEEVVLSENTKLSYAMFVNSGLKKVDIYEHVLIPDFCFAKCNNLQSVNIHNSLESIGVGAFSECLSLTEFNILGDVRILADQVFYGTDKLTKIVLPNSTVTLGNYCFYKANSLNEVVFGKNTKLDGVNSSVFKETNLTTFTVDPLNPYYSVDGNYLTDKDQTIIILAATGVAYNDLTIDAKYQIIGNGAFSGANINSLTFLNKDLVISDYAFSDCKDLKQITFPSEAGTVIGQRAFYRTTGLEKAINFELITNVGKYAFAETGLKAVTLAENGVFEEGAFFKSKVAAVTIGANANLGLGAFQNCLDLKTVFMPEQGGVHLGRSCFANCEQLQKIDLTKIDNIIERETFYNCKKLPTAILTNVEEIGDYAFADCSGLNNLEMPKVVKIGEGAFSRNNEHKRAPIFQYVTLPDTLTYIGDGAFLGCEGLLEINIPEGINYIGNYTFSYCLNLGKVQLADSVNLLGDFAFAGCEQLKEINLAKVANISKYAFAKCSSLKDIDLTSVETIGEAAFAETQATGSFRLERLTFIDKYAFKEANIIKFDAPMLRSIGESAFYNNYNLIEFVLSNVIENVEIMAFTGCNKLPVFSFTNDKLTTGIINDYAELVNGVLYTNLPSGYKQLTDIPAGLFVTDLVIPEGIYRIEDHAGNANQFIERIVLPDTLKSIGQYAFFGCKNLKSVEFKSFVAPALENSYNPNAKLLPTDPGYELLHEHFDIFGMEACYYNFIDLVGKKEPIQMILPQNEDIMGYDSVIYQAYFGTVEAAPRSEYVAMHKNMIDFIDLAKVIKEIKIVTLTDEKVINNAVNAYNGIKQDATDYGFTKEEWDSLVKVVMDAKYDLWELKLNNARKEVRDVQKMINDLPDTFDISKLSLLQSVAEAINSLKAEEKSLLDLTKYNSLVKTYEKYVESIYQEVSPIVNATNNITLHLNVLLTSGLSLAAATFILRKRIGK